jgi:hypothetical protein
VSVSQFTSAKLPHPEFPLKKNRVCIRYIFVFTGIEVLILPKVGREKRGDSNQQSSDCPGALLGEDRLIETRNGVFQDVFANSYSFHLYEILFDPNTQAPPLGDVNGDGVVDCADLKLVTTSVGETAVPGGYLGETGAPAQYHPNADVVRDGVVDGRDVSLVAQWKTGSCAGK